MAGAARRAAAHFDGACTHVLPGPDRAHSSARARQLQDAQWRLSKGGTGGRFNTATVSVYRVVHGLPQPVSFTNTAAKQWC